MKALRISLFAKPCMAIAVLLMAAVAGAADVWPGDSVEFSKAAFANPALPQNQDRITDNVWISRGNVRGIFNLAQETLFRDDSPADTRWAFAGLDGNPQELSAADFSSLNFRAWRDALGGNSNLAGNILDRPAVMHMITDDIYVDVRFTAWGRGEGAGGSFAYVRGAPADTDGDGVLDGADNCQTLANPDQLDGNSDGFGNLCDGDLNGDCITNVVDLGIFRTRFFLADAQADFNGDGVVNVVDLGILRTLFFNPPGPSGTTECNP